MGPRADRVKAVTVEVSAEERAIIEYMSGATKTTTANMVRVALWSLADHMQIEMPNGCFDLREGSGKYRRTAKNPHIRQD